MKWKNYIEAFFFLLNETFEELTVNEYDKDNDEPDVSAEEIKSALGKMKND